MYRAALVADGRVDVRSVSLPKLENGGVVVEMNASGICGTDLEKLSGGYTASTVLGHEVAGTIVESKSEKFKFGDNVIPHHHVACGECYYCKIGASTMCEGFRTSNFDPCGFADRFIVPEYNVSRGGVHKFANLTFAEASFAEPLGCCIRGLEKVFRNRLNNSNSTIGMNITNALVVGTGPIGLLHMELLKSQFPELDLVGVDVSETRLEFAQRHENAKPLKPDSEGSFSEEARNYTRGMGFDLVVIATGNVRAFAEALKVVRKAGSVLLFGAPHKGSTYSLDLQLTLLNELTLTSSYATIESEISEAILLLERRRIDVEKFITAKFPLAQINEAMTAARSEGHVKVVVTR